MSEQCPYGYSDPQRWCDWRNEQLAGTGKRWIVAGHGQPMITTDEQWSARQACLSEDRMEAERKRFNWRRQHPIGDE